MPGARKIKLINKSWYYSTVLQLQQYRYYSFTIHPCAYQRVGEYSTDAAVK
jgi:hypothetical protein